MFTEFFCGIGGLSACMPAQTHALSIDINQNALQVHRLNFGHLHACKTIESLTIDQARRYPRDFWWMSPPCQPYTRRGKQKDLDDPRTAGLRNILKLIAELKPTHLGLENVPEFQSSLSHECLMETLDRTGYFISERLLCPTELGASNQRRRYYLLASQYSLPVWEATASRVNDQPELEKEIDWEIYRVPEATQNQYQSAIHQVEAQSWLAGESKTTCFTAAYGRSPVFSGSYLKCGKEIRRFTPREILWQLGFPKTYQIPDWPPEKLWPLIGNSLSLHAVNYLLSHLPLDA
jgi:DNA (cytosine-5)-methyltransferase 1